ncbi:MAG: hypothetical protein IKW02_01135 [Clostridia bacterium]|nr:hypothetical protein [Clostridia bacterium]
MKKIFVLILAVLLLFSACGKRPDRSEYDDEKLKELKQTLVTEDKLCGVAYLGYMDAEFDEIVSYLQTQEYYTELSFLKDISLDRFASNAGGELYCIVPQSNEVTITVRTLKYDETFDKTAGDQLISISDGVPILIKGNISEIVPNLLIETKKEDFSQIFSPVRSLENGKMDLSENKFFDFTPYDLMEEFKNKE